MAEEIPALDNERLTVVGDRFADPSARAEAVLEQILEADTVEQAGVSEARMTVAEAIASRPIIDQDTGRTKVRALIVTTDENVLLAGSSVRNEYLELARQFDELHVMCVIARTGTESFDRAGDNIWFYQVRSKNWWTLPWAAKRAAREALTWNGIPRPDVIIGIDPFEAGLAARLIALNFDRPLQYHIHTNPFDPEFKSLAPDNEWRIRLARFLLRRAESVRTATATLKELLEKRYQRLDDIAVLPRFYNFTYLLNGSPAFDLHERFRDFIFIMMAFGPLTADSHLHDVFAAVHRLLRNPRIGLVVIGDGPAKSVFLEKSRILGIDKNVIFKKEPEDLTSYLKTADLMVELDTTEEGEVRVLQAAAAGLPVVMYATDLRRDLFKDGISGFLCEPEDLTCVTQKTSKYINTTAMRPQLSENAQDVAKERLHENPEAHYQALALSIEAALISDRE